MARTILSKNNAEVTTIPDSKILQSHSNKNIHMAQKSHVDQWNKMKSPTMDKDTKNTTLEKEKVSTNGDRKTGCPHVEE